MSLIYIVSPWANGLMISKMSIFMYLVDFTMVSFFSSLVNGFFLYTYEDKNKKTKEKNCEELTSN